jgi:uncharacterized Fe-S cluster-containing radical SAM superfamily enzyme
MRKGEATIGFRDVKFRLNAGLKGGDSDEQEIVGDFLGQYYFTLKKSDLEEIAPFRVENGELAFECPEKRARQKLSSLVEKSMHNLRNRLRNKKTAYISSASGLPLMGANEFGLVDRGTNIIEVKPSTGCNLSCIFCSVSEGENDYNDLLIEKEYLVQEFRKLAALKKHHVEACINPHGEPLLYPKIRELVRDLAETPNVGVVSLNTNGCMLSKKLIDELVAAGLARINLSIHSLDGERASKLAGAPYNVGHVLDMIKYCEGKVDVLLAPVLVPGQNEKDIDDIVELSKMIKNKKFPAIGIQNFLNYPGGRNITKEMPWEEFYGLLKKKEAEHDTRLIVEGNLFGIEHDETLPKPFRKNQVIKAELKLPGRAKGEVLAAAGKGAEARCITVYKCKKTSGTLRVRLLRDKHNIYTAVPA